MALDTKITTPDTVVFCNLNDEAIILNTETGMYYSLDEVGTRMWRLLAKHGQVQSTLHALLEEYDVNEEQLQQDMLDLVDKLVSEGLLQIDEANET